MSNLQTHWTGTELLATGAVVEPVVIEGVRWSRTVRRPALVRQTNAEVEPAVRANPRRAHIFEQFHALAISGPAAQGSTPSDLLT